MLQDLVEFCRSLPHVTEDIKWGHDQVMMIGGKMFCVFSNEKNGSTRLSFKVEDHRFLEMTDRPQFIPAPYLARARWVTVVDDAGLSQAELETLIRGSYQHYFGKLPKRVQAELGVEP